MIERALRLAREFHRMKQVDLAKKLHISTSYLSEIESGKKPVSLELLENYAEVFGIPASTFLMFKEKVVDQGDTKREQRAERLLQFFEWVTKDDEEHSAEEKAASSPGEAEKAVRPRSVRSVSH